MPPSDERAEVAVMGMRRRVLGGLVALAVLTAALVLTAESAGATDVSTPGQLVSSYGHASESLIRLPADITLGCSDVLARTAPAMPLTIDGQGRFTVTQGCPNAATFVLVGDLNLVGLRVTGGATGVVETGALTMTDTTFSGLTGSVGVTGIVVAGNVSLTRSKIESLSAPIVAGVVVAGNVTLTDSTISSLSATGSAAGVVEAGDLSLVESTVRSISGAPATGIVNASNTLSIVRSTLAEVSGTTNSASLVAAAIQLEITNSTITQNDGPMVFAANTATVVYSDIVQNGGTAAAASEAIDLPAVELPANAPEGLQVAHPALPLAAFQAVTAQQVEAQIVADAALSFFGSVVAQPQGGAVNCDVVPLPTSNGYNYSDDTTCGFTGTGDRQGAGNDPLLAALADNGGPTPTRLPLPTSPLLDAIPTAAGQSDGAAGITTDQRLLPRPAGAGCEIGAVELQPAIVVTPRFTG